MNPSQLITLSTLMMVTAVIIFGAAFAAAFLLQTPLQLQVLGHIGMMVSAILLKVGYVVRLAGQRGEQFSTLAHH